MVTQKMHYLGTTFTMKMNSNDKNICGNVDKNQNTIVISPTHKRTEGRAPVWGSEFTSKDAALQGGIQQKPLLQAERKIARSA